VKRERPFDAPGAFDLDGAAAYLSMSRDAFNEHVRHQIRVVRLGRLIRIPRTELARWLARSAARALER